MPFWTSSRTNDDEEAASLTRTPWSPIDTHNPDDPTTTPNTTGISEKGGRRWSARPDVRKWRGIKLAAASLVGLALVGLLLNHQGYSYDAWRRSKQVRDQGRPWKNWGNSELVDFGVNQGNLPLCERTMLVDWRSFQFGFGSTATTILQAGIVARMHGYTLLFDRGANKYGRYLDLFDPAPLECYAPEELYDPATYRKGDGSSANVGSVINDQFERPTIDRLLVGTDDIHPLNHHITALVYPDMSYLDSLPTLDASKPVPVSSSVPQVFAESFDRYSALSAEYFRFNGLLNAKVNGELQRLGLDERNRAIPSIGVHWRGGDKLERECVGSSQLSCGNVTHHCVTVWDSLPKSYLSSPTPLPKPRLLLMTTEPDALGLFRADSSCQRFDVQFLEHTEEKQSFLQESWNAMSDEERAADVQSMFVGSEILANHVDAAVVSPNSNLARLIMTRAGPRRVKEEGKIRSVDIYWHPVHYPPFKRSGDSGGCDGTWGGCWPHD